MEYNRPEVYRAVIASDIKSRDNFSGHGSAMAQAYNHMIMPLASSRDKETQVIWGIKDFEHRFGRKPEGMWLPETAVDLETLDIMARQGIKFTVLAPYQALRTRKTGESTWRDTGGDIDTTRPYTVRTGGQGRTISVFFYDGCISAAVAFERLLSDGERFAHRLLGAFAGRGEDSLLVNIATDGETFGHHHRHGDMALAYAMQYLETNKMAVITNYPQYLAQNPPQYEVEIKENSSWSCAHGVERWRSNCGCNSGLHPGWGQEWRKPLRSALNLLRDITSPQYEEMAGNYLKDPWAARNDYIDVVNSRNPRSLEIWLDKHRRGKLEGKDRVTVLKLLEMQRHAMLMYTSCGWFFDDISGIETIQILRYAGRVIQLSWELTGKSPKKEFLGVLAEAGSNAAGYGNGAEIYEKYVKPAMVNLLKVGAHYAISSLFETFDDHANIYCYNIDREDHHFRSAGAASLSVGIIEVTSQITGEADKQMYGVVNFGVHNVIGGIGTLRGLEDYRAMAAELKGAFDRADFSEVIRLMNRHFEGSTYTLRQLFRDKQRAVLERILNSTLDEITADYRRIYKRHAPLMRYLRDLGIPQPKPLQTTAEFVLNISLRQALAGDSPDPEEISGILEEAETSKVSLDGAGLGYVLEQTLDRLGEKLTVRPGDRTLVRQLDTAVGLARSLPFVVDLWKIQNVYYSLLQRIYPEMLKKARSGDSEAKGWTQQFEALGDKLRIRRSG
jgi:alpha-amylase/alpha-mannosidase (GH57 family)